MSSFSGFSQTPYIASKLADHLKDMAKEVIDSSLTPSRWAVDPPPLDVNGSIHLHGADYGKLLQMTNLQERMMLAVTCFEPCQADPATAFEVAVLGDPASPEDAFTYMKVMAEVSDVGLKEVRELMVRFVNGDLQEGESSMPD